MTFLRGTLGHLLRGRQRFRMAEHGKSRDSRFVWGGQQPRWKRAPCGWLPPLQSEQTRNPILAFWPQHSLTVSVPGAPRPTPGKRWEMVKSNQEPSSQGVGHVGCVTKVNAGDGIWRGGTDTVSFCFTWQCWQQQQFVGV